MKDKIIEIDKELDALDKEKKNFARRINYKINKLKKVKSELLEKCVQPEDSKAVWIEAPNEGTSVQVFLDNKWLPIDFLQLVPGYFVRYSHPTSYENSVHEVLSLPFKKGSAYFVQARAPEQPLRNIREEIEFRLKNRDA